MPRLLLVDPSIVDWGGHYFEYASRVLDAAKSSGYTTALAVNRRCKSREAHGADLVLPVFRWTFFENLNQKADRRPPSRLVAWLVRVVASYRHALAQTSIHLAYSRLAINCCRVAEACAAAPNWRARRARLRQLSREPTTLRLPYWLLELLRLCIGAAYWLRRTTGTLRASRVGAALRHFVPPLALALAAIVLLPLAIVLSPLLALRGRRSFATDFAADLGQALEQASIGPGDLVLVPTLFTTELLGMCHALRGERPARSARWALIFRRNIFEEYAPSFRKQNEHTRTLRLVLDDVRRRLEGVDLRYFTDTDALTTQYAFLGVVPFHTLTIPVSPRYSARRPTSRAPDRPLTATYLGDAREEKGFHYLPGAILDLVAWGLSPARVTFRLQSNFNTPDGEPAAIAARAQLMALDPGIVELVEGPFDSTGYEALVASSDLLLLPYERARYTARSSGVFAEALRAGIPSAVPAGTWMAALLEPFRQDHLARTFPAESRHGTLVPGNRLVEGLGPRACEVPDGTRHVVATIEVQDHSRGEFLHVRTLFADAEGTRLAREDTAVCLSSELAVVATAVPPAARFVRFECAALDAASDLEVERLEVRAYAGAADQPLGAVGVIFWDATADLGRGVRELAEHHDHYTRGARQAATGLGASFDAGTLLAQILAPTTNGRTTLEPASEGTRSLRRRPEPLRQVAR